MSNPMKQHGAFSWNELMTTNIEGAKKFYSKMFKWELKDMPMKDMGMDTFYTSASIDGVEKAGIMPLMPESEGMPPFWGAYVTVDDVDASAKQAQELGGNIIMEPRDIPKVGRFCVISDPQGAVLSLMTYFDQE